MIWFLRGLNRAFMLAMFSKTLCIFLCYAVYFLFFRWCTFQSWRRCEFLEPGTNLEDVFRFNGFNFHPQCSPVNLPWLCWESQLPWPHQFWCFLGKLSSVCKFLKSALPMYSVNSRYFFRFHVSCLRYSLMLELWLFSQKQADLKVVALRQVLCSCIG